jgi:hypothetical protein
MGLIVPSLQPSQPDDQAMNSHGFVGIDWGSEPHQVWVLDRDRQVVGERVVDPDGASLAPLTANRRIGFPAATENSRTCPVRFPGYATLACSSMEIAAVENRV